MALFYVDTSALVKRYRLEQGNELITELLDDPPTSDRFYCSFLSVLEITSVFLRLARGGQLPDELAREALAAFRRDVRDLLRLWPLNDTTVTRAVQVVEAHRLRSADALHLATALAISVAEPAVELFFVSADLALLDAGQTSGLGVLNPEAPDALERLAGIRGL